MIRSHLAMLNFIKKSVSSSYLVPAFFVTLLLLGYFIFRDYGLTCDEPLDRNTAMVNLKYVLDGLGLTNWARSLIPEYDSLVPLAQFVDRDYGVVFHLPAYVIERLFFKDDLSGAFKARHLLNFLYVYVGLTCLYLALKRIISKSAGIIAVGIFLLSPRLFAESFYNGKDLIVVAFAMVNLWTLTRYLTTESTISLILHAFSSALIVDTRIIGIAFVATSTGLFICRGFIRGTLKSTLKEIVLYLCSTLVFTVIFFPYLWGDPLHRLIEVFHNMSAFRHEGEILFSGKFYNDHALPLSYVPVWFAITTPPFILLAMVVGSMRFIGHCLKSSKHFSRQCFDCNIFFTLLFCMVIVLGSVLSVMLLHSSLYNGWRQMYFIYPELICFAVLGLMRLGTLSFFERFFLIPMQVLASIGGLCSLFFMLSTHPIENLYFNFMAQKPWHEYYDLDYWGNATHLAYEFMLKDQPQGEIRYCHESMIFKANRLGLAQKDLTRLIKVPCKVADYRINNFFGHNAVDYVRLRELRGPKLYELKVSGERVLEVIGKDLKL